MSRGKLEDKSSPLWKKISGGSLHIKVLFGNHRIKPGEKVRATEQELSRTMPDGAGVYHFELVEDGKGKKKVSEKEPEKKFEKVTPPKKEEYHVMHVDRGWFNVLSSTDKVMNETKLREDAAKKLKEKLEEETIEE